MLNRLAQAVVITAAIYLLMLYSRPSSRPIVLSAAQVDLPAPAIVIVGVEDFLTGVVNRLRQPERDT
jgi:hypothetical protein